MCCPNGYAPNVNSSHEEAVFLALVAIPLHLLMVEERVFDGVAWKN